MSASETLAIGFATLLWASAADAQVSPTAGSGDPRLQTVVYDANQIIELPVAVGYQLTVELAADERVENAAIGDSAAWQVSANKRGDRIFIKLVAGGAPTNLTVMTDTRTYAFDLIPREASQSTPYVVRFTYPNVDATAVTAETGGTKATSIVEYRLRGAKQLWPSGMGDDTIRTFIEWPADRAMPAVFSVDDTGQEVTVDGYVRDNRYVIDAVWSKLIFRLGEEVAVAERVALKESTR